ncbi:peptidylprolyl isomerase [Sarracenia purpurea var. burkii]
MAVMMSYERWSVDNPLISFKSTKSQIHHQQQQQQQAVLPMLISRRSAILVSPLPLGLFPMSQPSLARERRNRKTIPLEDYLITPDGLKYYDVVEGKGPVAEKGSTVQVHFDCVYRGITVVSSRESKLLAGNRTIAQRTVIVPPEAGYGQKGINEIPPGATFELNLELLQVMRQGGK